MSIEEFGRITVINDTKANVESLTGGLGEMKFARASDTNQLGFNLSGTWQWINVITTSPQELIGIMGWENGSPIGTGTIVDFRNGISASRSGTVITVDADNCGTYFRVSQPTPLSGVTGLFWKIPEGVYASGSLGVFNNGLALVPGTDYAEQIYVSGTYQYISAPNTGTVHVVHYAIPCNAQSFTPTGSSPFSLSDNDSVLLLDSDGVQLLDSEG